MKQKFFLPILTALVISFVFISCGDDEEDDSVTKLSSNDYVEGVGYFDGSLYYKITSDVQNTVTIVAANPTKKEIQIPMNINILSKKYIVTEIGDRAFLGCTDLTSLSIPNSVTSIGAWAFEGCGNLSALMVKSTTPPHVATWAFYQVNIGAIYVPKESVEAYKSAFGWQDFPIKAIE